jgi:hypothetical protein
MEMERIDEEIEERRRRRRGRRRRRRRRRRRTRRRRRRRMQEEKENWIQEKTKQAIVQERGQLHGQGRRGSPPLHSGQLDLSHQTIMLDSQESFEDGM